MSRIVGLPFCVVAALLIAGAVSQDVQGAQQKQTQMQMILHTVKITQRLNAQVPPNLSFRDETGKTVRLGDFFGSKPIVLSLVYFNCPGICPEVLDGEMETLKSMSLNLGKDYDAITVSFDPTDTPDVASAKRDIYAGQYGRPGSFHAWHFLTGDAASIDALTKAIGFHYVYDAAHRVYFHAASIVVLTPQGRISRYFYGEVFPERDLTLGLVEASGGKIGTLTDHALLICYAYDPATGRYTLLINRIVDAACGLTVLALGAYMLLMFRRDRKLAYAPRMVALPGESRITR